MSFIGYFESCIFKFEELSQKSKITSARKKEFKELLLQFSTSLQYEELGEDSERIKRVAKKLEEIKKSLGLY